MSVVNTNRFLSPIGMWNTGTFNGEDKVSVWSLTQALNVIGYFPIISGISGAIFTGVGILEMRKRNGSKAHGASLLCRGILQLCQIGFLMVPADFICSAIRSVMEWRKNTRDLQT